MTTKRKSKRRRIPRPELDRDQFKVLHAIRHIETKDAAKSSFLAYSTISKLRRNPRDGGTRFPRHTTLVELAWLAGKRWELVDDHQLASAGTRTERSDARRRVSGGPLSPV